MPDIEEVPTDTDVPGMATASAAGLKKEPEHGYSPTLGPKKKVHFSPAVKLRPAKPAVPTHVGM